MFEAIDKYMQKSKALRTAHLELSEPCIEIGTTYSREYRGLLAHFVKTMLPTKKEAVLCHACHNNGCSNPRHLYWGTYSENLIDSFEQGTHKCPRDHIIAKHGLEKANQIVRAAGKIGGAATKRRYASGEAAPLSTE